MTNRQIIQIPVFAASYCILRNTHMTYDVTAEIHSNHRSHFNFLALLCCNCSSSTQTLDISTQLRQLLLQIKIPTMFTRAPSLATVLHLHSKQKSCTLATCLVFIHSMGQLNQTAVLQHPSPTTNCSFSTNKNTWQHYTPPSLLSDFSSFPSQPYAASNAERKQHKTAA